MNLTPTQDLVMEVLAARDRLGDRWWPFPTSHRAALDGLERLGLIKTMSGIVRGTIRADITDTGREMYQRAPFGPRVRGYRPQARDIRADIAANPDRFSDSDKLQAVAIMFDEADAAIARTGGDTGPEVQTFLRDLADRLADARSNGKQQPGSEEC